MHNNNRNIAAVILAAGRSQRINQHKLILKFNNQLSFIEELINQFTCFGCSQIIIVVNKDGLQCFKQIPENTRRLVTVAINDHPERGRFYSLQTSLRELKKASPVFVHNVDNPFIDQATLKLLSKALDKSCYITPLYKKLGGHPVLISQNIVNDILFAKEYLQNLRDFFNHYTRQMVEVNDPNILVNINTEADYSQLFS